MKIVVINGQNHKGSTWKIGNILADKLSGDQEIREYFLPRDLNHFCCGCYSCLEAREKCPYWSEKVPIFEDMLAADLLIFTSPTYCMMPSAPMKAFLDLFFTNWMMHRPMKELFSKRAVVISTAAGAGTGKTTKLIADNLMNWGIPEVTRYGIAVNAMNWEMVPEKIKTRIEKDTDRIAAKIQRKKQVHVGIKTKGLFLFYRGMQLADWGASKAEKQYWEEQGWLSKERPWKKD